MRIGEWKKGVPRGKEVNVWHISATLEHYKELGEKGYDDYSFRLVVEKELGVYWLRLEVYRNLVRASYYDQELVGDAYRYECEKRAQHFMNFCSMYDDMLNYMFDYKERSDESKSYYGV